MMSADDQTQRPDVQQGYYRMQRIVLCGGDVAEVLPMFTCAWQALWISSNHLLLY